jgi:hypothetical protein
MYIKSCPANLRNSHATEVALKALSIVQLDAETQTYACKTRFPTYESNFFFAP